MESTEAAASRTTSLAIGGALGGSGIGGQSKTISAIEAAPRTGEAKSGRAYGIDFATVKPIIHK